MTSLLIAIVVVAFFQAQDVHQTEIPAPATIHRVGGSVSPPVLIASTEPVYPRSRWGKNTDHHVVVQLVVGTDGLPGNLEVLTSGGKSFDEAALKAVRTYRFKPSTELGKPVPVSIKVNVQFKTF